MTPASKGSRAELAIVGGVRGVRQPGPSSWAPGKPCSAGQGPWGGWSKRGFSRRGWSGPKGGCPQHLHAAPGACSDRGFRAQTQDPAWGPQCCPLLPWAWRPSHSLCSADGQRDRQEEVQQTPPLPGSVRLSLDPIPTLGTPMSHRHAGYRRTSSLLTRWREGPSPRALEEDGPSSQGVELQGKFQ